MSTTETETPGAHDAERVRMTMIYLRRAGEVFVEGRKAVADRLEMLALREREAIKGTWLDARHEFAKRFPHLVDEFGEDRLEDIFGHDDYMDGGVE